MRDRATRDLWPPLSSFSDDFQRRLPATSEGHSNLEAVNDLLAVERSQLRVGSGQEGRQDRVEVLVDLAPDSAKLNLFLFVKVVNDLESKECRKFITLLWRHEKSPTEKRPTKESSTEKSPKSPEHQK